MVFIRIKHTPYPLQERLVLVLVSVWTLTTKIVRWKQLQGMLIGNSLT